MCKLGLALVGGALGSLSALILLDRTGKGIRTAPRDAMISLTAPKNDLGLAFGVHRAMDTAGAMIGPVLAFVLLAAAPNAFSNLFLISFFIGMLGFFVIALLVREPRVKAPAAEKPDLKAAAKLLKGKKFRSLTIAGAALGLATASDGFIYLTLRQQVDFSNAVFPLLATGTALLYMLLAAPLGRVADRFGRGRVLIGGYVVLLAVYCILMLPSAGYASLFLVLALLGHVLRCHRRRPDGDGLAAHSGSAARERPRAARHRDEHHAPVRVDPVRRALDGGRRRGGDRDLRRRPGRRHGAGGARAPGGACVAAASRSPRSPGSASSPRSSPAAIAVVGNKKTVEKGNKAVARGAPERRADHRRRPSRSSPSARSTARSPPTTAASPSPR